MKSSSLRSNLIHALFATAAVAALAAQAADPDYFGQQRQITDGYYPQYNTVERHTKPESARTTAENEWLVRARIADSTGSKPQQFVAPAGSEQRNILTALFGSPEKR